MLLATRRSREPGEEQLWMFHISALEGEAIGGLQFETDRARFLGRGHTLRNAVSILDARPLSNTVGTVLDPVLALRRRVRIPPRSNRADRLLERPRPRPRRGACSSRQAPRHGGLRPDQDARRGHEPGRSCDDWGWISTRHSSFSALPIGCCMPMRRCARHARFWTAISSGPPALWAYGISGDLPIVLLHVDEAGDLGIVKELLRAREYWRLKRLAVDLVILNDASRHRGGRTAGRRSMPRSGTAQARRRRGGKPRRRQRLLSSQRLDARSPAANCCKPRRARSSPHDRAA